MSGRDLEALHRAAIAELAAAGGAAAAASDPEAALLAVSGAVFGLLGDRRAHERPGALKAGERQFFVAGVFLVAPGASGHLLVAEHGFPPEQHRLRIPIDIGHPGWVYQHRIPLILANTDRHAGFKQILKTARMGSALYGPMLWRGEMLGQLVMAAQARDTFAQPDLDVLVAFAALASTVYVAHDGSRWVGALG